MNPSELSDRVGIVRETAYSHPSPDSPAKRETDDLHLGSSNERGPSNQRTLIPDLGPLGDNTPFQSDHSLFKSPSETRQSIKRHEPLIHSPSGKCMYYHKDILDALQKTVIPIVPTSSAVSSNQSALSSSSTTTATATATAHSPIQEPVDSTARTNNITPTIDYFANTILYYHDGVFDTPITTTSLHPALPALISPNSIVFNPYLFEGEDDYSDDGEDDGEDNDEECESDENPNNTILPPNLAEREEGVVCTSL